MVMKKILISLVIEGSETDIQEIKGNLVKTASEVLVSCSVSELPEPKKLIEIPSFLQE